MWIALAALVGVLIFAVKASQDVEVCSGSNVCSSPGFLGIIFNMANRLSAAQIAQLAQNAGFSGENLSVAVAIALAESGGNPSAYNPETAVKTPNGQGSFGLWQIYLFKHPEFAGQNLYDPQTNANIAFFISSNGTNFNPWSTFNPRDGSTPRYLAHVADADAAVASLNQAPETVADNTTPVCVCTQVCGLSD